MAENAEPAEKLLSADDTHILFQTTWSIAPFIPSGPHNNHLETRARAGSFVGARVCLAISSAANLDEKVDLGH